MALGARFPCARRIAPDHFRKDFATALGVTQAADAQLARATLRLGRELLAFLRENRPDVDPQPDIARYLADGTLELHLGFIECAGDLR